MRSVQSVLNQKHSDFELIVVDDGSTDGGPALVESVTDSRVLLIRQANGGVSRARNAGVRQAGAEWVAFLDADDEYAPEFLEIMAAFIGENAAQNIALAGANYYIEHLGRTAKSSDIKSGIHDYFQLFRDLCSPNNSSSTVVCRQKFLKTGGFPEGVRQFEDWICWLKLAFAGNFGYVSKPLGLYRNVEGGVSRRRRPARELFEDAEYFPRTIRDGLEKNNHSPERIISAWRCSNDFIVGISQMLARNGGKKYALKMLTYLNLKFISFEQPERTLFLLLHLLTPQIIKQIYRNLKANRTVADERFRQ